MVEHLQAGGSWGSAWSGWCLNCSPTCLVDWLLSPLCFQPPCLDPWPFHLLMSNFNLVFQPKPGLLTVFGTSSPSSKCNYSTIHPGMSRVSQELRKLSPPGRPVVFQPISELGYLLCCAALKRSGLILSFAHLANCF